jgi:hypothetical protein
VGGRSTNNPRGFDNRLVIVARREQIAHDLWSYGEDDLAERVANRDQVSGAQIGLICGVAWKYATEDKYALPSGYGMTISKALAHAAVEVLEGEERDLARKRRRPGSVID